MTPTDQRRASVHEAGHAVAALGLGILVRRVVVVPHAVTTTLHPRGELVTRDLAARRAAVELSGAISEGRYFLPEDPTGAVAIAHATVDIARAEALAAAHGLTMASVVALASRTVAAHEGEIIAVASALRTRGALSGEEIDAIVGRTGLGRAA